MYDPVTIKVTPKKLTVDAIEQAFVEVAGQARRPTRLVELLKAEEPEQAIIFCRTKIGASRLDKTLRDRGLDVKALHGDMSQGSRDGVMIAFKDHRVRLLVATDIAARGLDIEHVTHVINYDVPDTSETYVHRIGRTGRVGRTGRAITFVTPTQRDEIGRIEREAKTTIGEWEPPEERLEHAPPPAPRGAREEREPRGSRRQGATAPGRGAGERRAREALRQPRRAQRITEEDLRWALSEGAVVPEEAIHDVRVLHRFSFVELDADRPSGPSSASTAPSSRAGRSGSRSRAARRRRSGPRCAVSSAIRPSSSVEVDRLADVAAGARPSWPRRASPSSWWALTISTGVSTSGLAQLAQASIPDLRGIIASSRIRSGARPGPPAPAAPITSSPSAAVVTS